MNKNWILVGSNYFFKNIKGFHSKDTDYATLIDNPIGFNYVRQTSGKFCLFEWKRMPPEEFISYTLNKGPTMQIGKFLIPEFNNEIGFTIEHLKQLAPLIEKLDDKHKYEKIIFNSYIENNSFTLTEEQRLKAYEEYKKYRE